MRRLRVPEPVSGGIILSYKCVSECRHCMYACSPTWRDDWISEKGLKEILTQLAGRILASPFDSGSIGVNYGLHFTGGEPFLNFGLLLKATQGAYELKIPSTFVETNCFWCIDDETTKEKLMELKDAGLHGVLISVNPFILEYVPFERTERAIKVCGEIFGRNVLIYQEFFYRQFQRLKVKEVLPFEKYLKKVGLSSLYHAELLHIGRAPYKLGCFYKKYPAKHFFDESCEEELTRNWHIHIDNHYNYMTGYCGGISLGDARDLNSLFQEVDLDERPILDALVRSLGEFYEFCAEEFGYKELLEGYVSKCHLCVDLRKHLAHQTDEFKELQPKEFYNHLEGSQ